MCDLQDLTILLQIFYDVSCRLTSACWYFLCTNIAARKMQRILALMGYNLPFVLRNAGEFCPQEISQWHLSGTGGHQWAARHTSCQQRSAELAVRVWPTAKLLLEFYFMTSHPLFQLPENGLPFHITLKLKMHISYCWNCLFMSVLTWVCKFQWHRAVFKLRLISHNSVWNVCCLINGIDNLSYLHFLNIKITLMIT